MPAVATAGAFKSAEKETLVGFGEDFAEARSPKSKSKLERDMLIAQDLRRSSVIQRDEDIVSRSHFA